LPELEERLHQEGIDDNALLRWTRLPFGWQSFPYFALRMLARALEIVTGAPDDANSAFAWAEVQMNLPGMDSYDPGLPRIQHVRADGLLAALILAYFDDGRVFGPTRKLVMRALCQVTAGIQHLGNQDATRKWCPVSTWPGAWAGSVTYADQDAARKLVTQAKWDKTKDFLNWVQDHMNEGRPMGTFFCSCTGFLLHVMDTYDIARCYLQGFFLAQNAWWGDQDDAGYKRQPRTLSHSESVYEHCDADLSEGMELLEGQVFDNLCFIEALDDSLTEEG